jgi:hypothetical protein
MHSFLAPSAPKFAHSIPRRPFKKSLHAAEQDRPDVAAERRALQRLGGKRGNANSGLTPPQP